MVEREEVMIVRKVYSANTLPNIGAMFPQNEDNENVCIHTMYYTSIYRCSKMTTHFYNFNLNKYFLF